MIIIGAGPGGYELAAEAARKGENVTLIERDRLGGTCLNRGCIPTKAMAHAADIINEARAGSEYGINYPAPAIDFGALCARRDAVVTQLREGIGMLLANVNVITGNARFVGPRQVEVNGQVLSDDKIVIATGSVPAALPVPGAENALTSDGLLALESIPASLAIIGGGVIGMEFASIFNTLGSKVTVIEYCKEILPPFDKDIAKRLRTQLAAAGITFLTATAVTAIDGYRVVCEAKGKPVEVEADVIAMAVGRRPCLPEGLDKAGVELTERGAIKVDPVTLETTAPGVYAIGDVNALCMLAHVASAQGRRVLGEDVDLDVVPSVVFTTPEVAMIGKTEQALKEADIDFATNKAMFRSNGKAIAMGDVTGIVKVMYDKETGHILGASIMGPHAADLIQEFALAMASRLPLSAISRTIHSHPSLSETLWSSTR